MARSLSAAAYSPGEVLDVTIQYERFGIETPLVVGYIEELPPGWTYLGIVDNGGAPPGVAPEVNAQGALEFAWITVPSMPGYFTYQVQAPVDAAGLAHFSGYGLYRFTGAQIETGVIETYIPQARL